MFSVYLELQVYVRLRPFFREFLERMSQMYEVRCLFISKRLDRRYLFNLACFTQTPHLFCASTEFSDYSFHGFKESLRWQAAQHPGSQKTAGQVSDEEDYWNLYWENVKH